jgi:hypothetical protein
MIISDVRSSASGVRKAIGSVLRKACRLCSSGPRNQAGLKMQPKRMAFVLANLSRFEQVK